MSSRTNEKLILLPRHIYLRQRVLAWLAVILSLVGGSLAGLYHGSDYSQQLIERNTREMQAKVDKANDKVESLSQQVADLKHSQVIDQEMKLTIQDTIQSLESRIVQLNEDLAFYKNIMAPGESDKGLKIQKLDLQPGLEKRVYKYKLVLAQIADNNRYISGVVEVNLIGFRGGSSIVIPFHDVGGATELGLKFRFRYFQEIQGELRLPPDFQVSQAQVVAQVKGRRKEKVERVFAWKVGAE